METVRLILPPFVGKFLVRQRAWGLSAVYLSKTVRATSRNRVMKRWALRVGRFVGIGLVFTQMDVSRVSVVRSETVVIDVSRTIDATGSLPNSGIDVLAGAAGPTTVRLVEGAEVATLSGSPSFIRDNSSFSIEGGLVGGPIDAFQRSTVRLVSGAFDYSRSRDAFWPFDLPTAVRLHDEATMLMQGGSIDLVEPVFMVLTSAVEARDRSRLRVEEGRLTSWAAVTVRVADFAELQVTGGHIESRDDDAIRAVGRASVRVSSGLIVGGEGGAAIRLDDQSRLDLSGATLVGDEANGVLAQGETVAMIVNATLHVSDAMGVVSGGAAHVSLVSSAASYNECCMALAYQTGTLRMVDSRGGGEESVFAMGRGRVVLVGNQLGGALRLEGQSTTDLLSGMITENERHVVRMKDDATLNLRGGKLRRVNDALEDGVDIYVAGRANLNVYAWSPSYGDGILSGRFRDGTLIDLKVTEAENGRVLLYDLKAVDYEADLTMDARDIDRLGNAIRDPSRLDGREFPRYDLDRSGSLDEGDLETMLHTYLGVDFGDMNLDGYFDSTDLIDALAAGLYDQPVQASWSSGDWNQDTRFDSTDLLMAFQTGGYLANHGLPPDVPVAPSPVVPEPSGVALGLGMLFVVRRKKGTFDRILV